MVKIHQLSDALSNKIAAGEVVERPASVVKELVENAVDAKSTVIDIFIKEAGLEEIRVIDNGIGIDHEDVKTAFLRHATSKIKEENDLFRVRTLGFRGEALPSIASVAKVTLQTCSETENEGTKVEIEGGHIKGFERANARKGTDLSIRELFFNTPARLKYLKTIHTELGHITDTVSRIALCYPQIAFRLIHFDKLILKTSGNGDVRQVLASLYGLSIAKDMVAFVGHSLDFQVTGYMAKPEVTRASRNYMTLIVNGRYVRSIGLQKAILEGFHTLLPIGRYPICLLEVKMDPQLLDVNVHPSKLEVRFSKENELKELITETIRQQWKQETIIPSGIKPSLKNEKINEQTVMEWDGPYTKKESPDQAPSAPKQQPFSGFQSERPSVLPKKRDFNERAEGDKIVREQERPHPPQSNDDEPHLRIPPLYLVGQAQGTYILAQNEDGLYIIDQHAAQERLKYEFYRRKVQEVAREVQELLLPLTLEFSPDEVMKISEYKEELEAVGVFLEPFGNHSFIVRSHPSWFPTGEEKETIEEMIEQLLDMKKISIEKVREEAAILMSCKGSIKANRYLKSEEMEALLQDIRQAEDPFTCPHGRPILIKFSTYELEKMFKRVM